MEKFKCVIVSSFVERLCKNIQIKNPMQYGRKKGWLEEIDEIQASEPITRKQVARILHMYLRNELCEPDLMNWKNAEKLRDLYECRVCVNHVAQIYEKGIIGSVKINGNNVFGMDNKISIVEAEEIVERVYDRYKRFDVEKLDENMPHIYSEMISKEKLEQISKETNVLLIDLRTRDEFEDNHFEGAINIKLIDILNGNNDCLYYNKLVVVYCNNGYQSKVAADYISDITKVQALYSGLNLK